jgi:HK97 family phage portal protein
MGLLQRFSNIITRSKPFKETSETFLSNGFSLFNLSNKAKVNVTTDTALKLSTFYTCVRSISEDVAKLPFKIQFVDSNGNRLSRPNHPAALLLNQKPNGFSTPFTFKQTLIERALRKGNGYAFIERDTNAVPVALYFIDNEYVTPILKNRQLFYKIEDTLLGLSGTFTSDDVFHLRGFGNGYVGNSVIQYANESIANGIALQEYGNDFFGGNGSMMGLLTLPNIKDENAAKAVKQSLLRSLEQDKIGAVTGNVSFTKMSVDPNEAQFIEAVEAKVNDIARWFRMPLGKLQKDSVSNIEALEIQYVNDTLMPWIVRFEQECELKLISKIDQPFLDAKIETFELLRGDTAAQERRIKTLFHTGMQSPNQLLKSMGMNTIGSEGDKRYLPVNMIPADMVSEFWAGKQNSQATTASPDSTGSGNTNGNITIE